MQTCRILAVAALAAIAAGCSTSDKPAPIVRTVVTEREVPAEARKPCAAPVRIPDRDLAERETVTLWGSDRTALRICEARRAAAVTGGGNVQ